MQMVSLPGSEYALGFESVLSRQPDRPDMLLIRGGATVLVGVDKVSSILRPLLFNVCAAKSVAVIFTPF